MTRECIWVDEDQHRPVPRLFSRAEILPADDPVSFSADPSDASRLPPQKSPLQRKTTVGRSEENETYRTMINKDSFHDCYRNERQLQKGSFGIVYEATLVRRDKTTDGSQKEKKTNTKKVAVKVIDRLKLKQVDDHAVFREVRILHELADVPGVITLVDFFVEPKTLYVVQTLAAGGDVFERLTQRQHYTEEVARNLARTLLQTLAEIHNRKIVHRDLKPGNLLLADDSDDESILLADFGFATHLGPQGKRRTRCGTPHFVAPEVILDTPYTEAVDMWSCGCILYMLLSGCPPFQGDNLRTVFRNIRAGNFAFHNTNWSNVSIPAKQMIVHLLTVNPKHRWTASQALESSWMKMPTTDSNKLSDNDLSGVLQSIRSRRKLKAAMDAVRWAATAEFWSPKSIMMSDSMKTWDDLSDISITINVADHMTNNGILLSPGTPIKMIAFDDRYTLIRKVKKGPFASVWECCDNETQKMCAVKIIPRPSLTSGHDEEVLNEVSILESVSVDNPESIVQLIEFYEEEEVFYVVMELMNGGNVLDRLEKRSHYSECDARNLIRKLLQAVKILHENNIAHRDIKPENLLLESQESDSDIKLCDFGFSRRVHTPESLTHRVGTPPYVAPEIIKNIPHDERVDLWSVGITSFFLLVGYSPFAYDDRERMCQQIKMGAWSFHKPDWENISPEAQELIAGLLQIDPVERLSAAKALQNKWIQESEETLSGRDLNASLTNMQRTRRHNLREKTQRTLTWMAHKKDELLHGGFVSKPIETPTQANEIIEVDDSLRDF